MIFEFKYNYAFFQISADNLADAQEEALTYFLSLFDVVQISEIELLTN
jgi:hypothetical protein